MSPAAGAQPAAPRTFPTMPGLRAPVRRLRRAIGPFWAGCLAGAAGTALITGLLSLASLRVNVLSMAVCYQLLVLVVSGAFGAGAGLATGVLAVAAFNWFFIPPVHTFTVADSRNWVALLVFGATALITAQLAAGSRRHREQADARRRDAEGLAELARSALAGVGLARHPDGVGDAAARALGVAWCRVVLPGEDAGLVGPLALTPSHAGFGIPLVVDGRPLGILEVGPARPGHDPNWRRPGFAGTVGALVSLAVERGRLLDAALEAESLRRSDELKSALIRTVSHELRTPLARLLALLETATLPGEDVLAHVERARDEVEQITELIDEVMFLSELESGTRVVSLGAVPVLPELEAVVESLGERAARAGVHLRAEGDGSIELAIRPRMVRVVGQNLAENALRYAGPGATFTLAIEREGDTIVLRGTDDGVGVEEDVLPRLFERFYRADRARASWWRERPRAGDRQARRHAGGRHGRCARRSRGRARGPLRVSGAVVAHRLVTARSPSRYPRSSRRPEHSEPTRVCAPQRDPSES